MKEITIKELQSDTENLINNIVINDDFLEAQTDTDCGHAAIISGREWQMFRELMLRAFNE